MIKPSSSRNLSITINMFEPLILGGGFIRSLENEISSYSHTISANGGFTSASITINSANIDDWVLRGLGRHIVAYGAAGEIVWEGFVDNISINLGNITIERGRLTEICNRCTVTFTPVIQSDEGQEESGTTTQTTTVDDQESIDKYGIWEQVVSGGSIIGVGADEAEKVQDYFDKADYLRDVYLRENKEPEVSHSPIIGTEGGDITITLDCKGYVEWLTYVYNYEVEELDAFSIEVSGKILAVITEDPNHIFPTDGLQLDYNGMLINEIESKDRTARTIIDEAVSIGDANNNRWLFGVYENRTPRYCIASSSIDYLYYISSNIQRITDVMGSEIAPWDVRPGKMVFIPDTVLGSIPYDNIRSDVRCMFLEEVNFTAPDTLNLTGKKIKSFDQLQAQQGLA